MTDTAEIILHEIKLAIERQNSPWCDRKGAAAYCSCSPTTIDRAANAGIITRHDGLGDPRFKKKDLDAWIESKKKERVTP